MSLFRRKHTHVSATRVSRSGAAMAEGWNGLPWGASLATFRARFPHAHQTESDWWQIGQGPESFCGVTMAITQYAFNSRDELCTVAFIPDPENRPRLSVAAVNELGAPDGMDLTWTFADVVVEVKLAGVVATLTHSTYSER
jgi:hypothetical protein